MATNEVENIGQYDDNITADTMVQQMMKCTNADRGCTWQGKLETFQDHKAKCPKEKVLCSYYQLGCSTHVCQNEQEMHDSDNAVEHLALARKCIQSLVDEIATLRSRVQSVEENHSVMENNINSSKNEVDKRLHARDIEQNQLQEELRKITSKVDESPSQPALPQQPRSITRWVVVLSILIAMLGTLIAIPMNRYTVVPVWLHTWPWNVQNAFMQDQSESKEDLREHQQIANMLQELKNLVTRQENFTEELMQLNLKLDSKLGRDELTNASIIEAELQLLQEKATNTDKNLSGISKDISEKIKQQLEEIRQLQNTVATVKHVADTIAPIMLEIELLKGKLQVLESLSHNHHGPHHPHHRHHHHHRHHCNH